MTRAQGNCERALAYLERAYEQHERGLTLLKVDSRLDAVRSNPRFQDLLRRMNFPD